MGRLARWFGLRNLADVAARLRSVEERIGRLETDLRTVREAEQDARRKLVDLGLRLRDLEAERAPSDRPV